MSTKSRKFMYGLPKAGIIANERLVKHLAEYGYDSTKHTSGPFTHATRSITFSLVINGFGVKYVGNSHILSISSKPSSHSTTAPLSGKASSTAASLSLGTKNRHLLQHCF
jgi:hypothetical protein